MMAGDSADPMVDYSVEKTAAAWVWSSAAWRVGSKAVATEHHSDGWMVAR